MLPNKQAGTKSRRYKLPDSLSQSIEACLQHFGYSLQKPQDLAKAVLKLSDFYIANPAGSTPWHQPWAKAAYLSYYFPLNYLRTAAVFEELKRVDFFRGLNRFIDFGCGISSIPFLAEGTPLKAGVGIDKSVEAIHLLEDLLKGCSTKVRLYQQFNEVFDDEGELGIFSYVLTETRKLPRWAPDLEALLIIEPSTQQDGRYLMDLRDALLEDEFQVWAPCTHQKPCPLLNKSKKDWCHDRITVDLPEWYEAIEKDLPMKNKTITYSYLAVRRDPPNLVNNLARSVGDLLEENGKYREMICRGEDREFLAWLTKEHSDAPTIARGQLFQLPNGLEKKADEIRVPSGVEISPSEKPTKG